MTHRGVRVLPVQRPPYGTVLFDSCGAALLLRSYRERRQAGMHFHGVTPKPERLAEGKGLDGGQSIFAIDNNKYTNESKIPSLNRK